MSSIVAAEAVSATRAPARRGRLAYSDPYVAGIGIGIMLLAAYVIVGRGLGATGAFSSVVAAGVAVTDPAAAAANDAIVPYLETPPLADWLVLEIIGVTLGALASAHFAGRLKFSVEPGAVTLSTRLLTGMAGGALMGLGARLARGCTSGLALSGGAILSVAGWIFIVSCFAAGYAFAPFTRKLWR